MKDITSETLAAMAVVDSAFHVESMLPPVLEGVVRSEIDYYGASHIIASRIGLDTVPLARPGSVSWHHGPNLPPLWGLGHIEPRIPESEMDYPFHMVPRGAVRLLVQKKEEIFFESLGSISHIAVGAPFCYVEPGGTDRITGSLVAMPSHSFVGGGSNHRLELAEEYAEYLSGIRATFPFVCVCLYADDFESDGMCAVYHRWGLPVIRGAGIRDLNSLRRMRRLFELFDCMTSNDIGSHVFYASSTGCKVFLTDHSLFGEKRAIWEKHPFYESRPNVLTNVLRWVDPDFLREKWPWLYRGEGSPVANIPWANEFLGVGNVRPPVEIARLLGWAYPIDGDMSHSKFVQFAPLLGQLIQSPREVPGGRQVQSWVVGDSRRRKKTTNWRRVFNRMIHAVKRRVCRSADNVTQQIKK